MAIGFKANILLALRKHLVDENESIRESTIKTIALRCILGKQVLNQQGVG